MNTAIFKNRTTKIVAVGAALSLMVCSFAFFTDRETHDTVATVGDIDLVWEDASVNAPTDYDAGQFTGSNNEFALDDAWDNTNGGLVSSGNVINPGDYFDLSYVLTNDGNKSIDVRQRLVIESSVVLNSTDNGVNDPYEYALTISGGNNVDSKKITKTPTSVETMTVAKDGKDGTRLIYDLEDIILDGVGTGAETEDGAVSGAYTVRLDFDKKAKNAFLNGTVDIGLYATAKQHRNTTVDDFPAFAELADITNDETEITVGDKVIEKIN